MPERHTHKYVVYLLAGTMLVSLFFCLHLLLLEYLRILILGMAMVCVYATFPRSFVRHFAAVCFLAVVYGYTLVILDPALNGVSLLDGTVPAFNSYRVLTLSLLVVCAAIELHPYVLRREPLSGLRDSLTRGDVRVVVTLAGLAGVYTMLDVLHALNADTSPGQAVLRGTKVVDLILVYVLIRRLAPRIQRPRIYANLLVFAFLGFAGFAALIGGVRATAAYNKARFPQRVTEYAGSRRTQAMLGVREKLLRVFSLNSRETRLVFEAGYHAGQQDWEAAESSLTRAQRFARPGLTEMQLIADVATGDYASAIAALESLPIDHDFSTFTRNRLREHDLPLHEPGVADNVLYLAGLLAMHEGDTERMRAHLDEFLERAPLHANAVFFRFRHDPGMLRERATFRLPARGWLQPVDEAKPLYERPGHVTLPFNQQLRGHVWLAPGTYEVTVHARDDGTLLTGAERAQFDPACKTRVWVGRDMADFSVYATNRQFQAYTLQADVYVQPISIVVEFLNDTFDDEHGWDRNLSVSHLTFRRIETP